MNHSHSYSETAKAADQPPIPATIGDAQKALVGLHACIDQLANRVGRAMRNAPLSPNPYDTPTSVAAGRSAPELVPNVSQTTRELQQLHELLLLAGKRIDEITVALDL